MRPSVAEDFLLTHSNMGSNVHSAGFLHSSSQKLLHKSVWQQQLCVAPVAALRLLLCITTSVLGQHELNSGYNCYTGLHHVRLIAQTCMFFASYEAGVVVQDKQRILEGCCQLVPSLKHAQVVADWAGLRPARDRVRLELEYHQVCYSSNGILDTPTCLSSSSWNCAFLCVSDIWC